jgi:hypothetical protein
VQTVTAVAQDGSDFRLHAVFGYEKK